MLRTPDFVQCLDASLSFDCHDSVGKRMLFNSTKNTDTVADTFCSQARERVVQLQRNQGVGFLCPAENFITSVMNSTTAHAGSQFRLPTKRRSSMIWLDLHETKRVVQATWLRAVAGLPLRLS